MGVAVAVGSSLWSVGSGSLLFAFFSTVSVRLEPEGWGTRFPAVMNQLYRGSLPDSPAARAALDELHIIRAELSTRPPTAVVWDVEDRARTPLWGAAISDDVTDLGNYFVTDDGRDLFEVLDEAVGYTARSGRPLTIE